MSLILDALNKADREREPTQAIPSIASPYIAPVNQVAALPGWVFALAGALAVSVFVMVVLLVKMSGAGHNLQNNTTVDDYLNKSVNVSTEEVKAAEPFSQYAMPVSADPKFIPSKSGAVNAVEPSVFSEEITSLYKKSEQPRVAPNVEQRVMENSNKKADASQALDFSKNIKESAAAKKSVEPLVSDAELAVLWAQAQQETTPPEVPASANEEFSELSFLYQLPESFQERIPTLMYQNHIYSARASAVIINGVTYKKGDQIADQLIVESIAEEELVLSYMNKPFKLAALSSWVKMN